MKAHFSITMGFSFATAWVEEIKKSKLKNWINIE